MGRQWHSGAKNLNEVTVTEPMACSTGKTGQRTRFSTEYLFQLRAHKSNSDAPPINKEMKAGRAKQNFQMVNPVAGANTMANRIRTLTAATTLLGT